jgi:hypothetical protein
MVFPTLFVRMILQLHSLTLLKPAHMHGMGRGAVLLAASNSCMKVSVFQLSCQCANSDPC